MTIITSIGLMSGTSMDGIDAAIITSDGNTILDFGEHLTFNYPKGFRSQLKELVATRGKADKDKISEIEEALTRFHAMSVESLIKKAGLRSSNIDIIGFHGHTIDHSPEKRSTWQIGKPDMLAETCGIDVIGNFRENDISNGGQGAPLIPLYHKALMGFKPQPTCILNIGGVANITYADEENLIAFDTGPGNALIDDFVLEKFGKDYDDNGDIASKGKVNKALLDQLLSNIYFHRKPPKSLDRNHFDYVHDLVNSSEDDMSDYDIVATLSEFTVRSIISSIKHLPEAPLSWYVCGGGVYNKYILNRLQAITGSSFAPIDRLDARLDSDAIEAQGFAFLAIRSKLGLPISFATTTGVKMSSATGGVFYPA